jgi:hypothetical protein
MAQQQLLSGHSMGLLIAQKAIVVGLVKIQMAFVVEESVEIRNDVLVDHLVVDHQHDLAA